MKRRIPYFSFKKINSVILTDFECTFRNVLDSKWYILGKELEHFENSFARYLKVRHAIGVGSGLDALGIGLTAIGLKQDDEVILPSFSFIATILSVIHVGAKPVLVDVDPQTCVLNPHSIYPVIGPKTKVILPVHMYGYPCDMEEITKIADQNGIHIIEDNAQAVGAETNGRKTGSFGHINAASFYPTKPLGAIGDGGIITTNNEQMANKCRSLRNYGLLDKKHHHWIGYNSRLDELQAALLAIKLKYLDQWIEERRELAQKYMLRLKHIKEIKLPYYPPSKSPSFHIFPIRSDKRDALKKYLGGHNIDTMIHYEIPSHLQESMKYLGFKKGSFPVAEEICKTELSLPMYPGLSDDDIDFIADRIHDFFSLK
jgi:dTDP-4-amino-4,6-dideoxygalactose transaminase